LVEQLEERTLLSWMTVISHGNGSSPRALKHITDAVQSKYEEVADSAQVTNVFISPDDNHQLTFGAFLSAFGSAEPLPDTNWIVQVDWSPFANLTDGLGDADAVGGRLGLILGSVVERQPSLEGIHLIGHSRGAFVVSTAAAVLQGKEAALRYAPNTSSVVSDYKSVYPFPEADVINALTINVTTLDPNPVPFPLDAVSPCLQDKQFQDGVFCVSAIGQSDGALISDGIDRWENYYREGAIIGGKGFQGAGVQAELPDEYLDDHWQHPLGALSNVELNPFGEHSAVHQWYAEAISALPIKLNELPNHWPLHAGTHNRWTYNDIWGALAGAQNRVGVAEENRPRLDEVKPSAPNPPPPDEANVELSPFEFSDTSGEARSTEPGVDKDEFLPGETVRITLSANNAGASVPVLVTLDVGAYPDNVVFGSSSTVGSPLETGETDYYSFDWTIPEDVTPGAYGIRAAIQSSDQNLLYDTTSPGRDSGWAGSWLPYQFWVVDPTPPPGNPDIEVTIGSREIREGDFDPFDFGYYDQNLPGPAKRFTVRNFGSDNLAITDLVIPDGFMLSRRSTRRSVPVNWIRSWWLWTRRKREPCRGRFRSSATTRTRESSTSRSRRGCWRLRHKTPKLLW